MTFQKTPLAGFCFSGWENRIAFPGAFPYNGDETEKGGFMIIYQTKPVFRNLWIWIALLTAFFNLLLSLGGMIRLPVGSGWIGSLIFGAFWGGVFVYVALFGVLNARNVRKKRLFLTVSGFMVLIQRMNFRFRVVNRKLLNLGNFSAFSSRPHLGGANWIFGTLRTGKSMALMNANLFEKTGPEIAAQFNRMKGPVVAHFREEGLPS